MASQVAAPKHRRATVPDMGTTRAAKRGNLGGSH